MQDHETGSWWQQISGMAISGPLKGKKLAQIFHDELSFSTWKIENSGGRVLRPDPDMLRKQRYASSDWEKRVGRLPVPDPFGKKDRWEARTIVVGVIRGSSEKAYELSRVLRSGIIIDKIGKVHIALIVGEDNRSIRCFGTIMQDRPLEFFRVPDVTPMRLRDSTTGSEWDFTGRALSGSLKGSRLEKIPIVKDYWFDWKNYHPDTLVYQ